MIDTFGAAFGRLVKRKRAEAKMTQAQLACALYPNLAAEEAEKRKGDISKLENGKVPNPTTITVHKLAQALGISDEDLDALQRRVQMSPSEKLDNVAILDRDALELLAGRFEIEKPHALRDAALRDLLTKKAEEYRALKAEVDTIDEGLKRLSNLKAAAQDAIARVDLEEVEGLLSRVQEVELEEAAKTAELRANNALLRGKVDQAFSLFNGAANSFEGVNAVNGLERRLRYGEALRAHGFRFGGDGILLAIACYEEITKATSPEQRSELWANAMVRIGRCLQENGTRLAGEIGANQLSEAVLHFREALAVYTKAKYPANWAITKGNLGGALFEQGIRNSGEDGARLLAETVIAYRDALKVYTKTDHPVDWAMAQNNLGNALLQQSDRTSGEDGDRLLAEAVTAYRDALTIYTEADYPVDWAMTQNNLGNALNEGGIRTKGKDGTRLLAEAGTAFRDALTVYKKAEYPVAWATIQTNLGNALSSQGFRTSGEYGTRVLSKAVTAYLEALTIRTKADHPVQWAATKFNLSLAEEAIADHEATDDPRPHMIAALDHVEAALTVYDTEHMSYDFEKATRHRDHIKARLAELA